jgi:molecular chaperone DnaK
MLNESITKLKDAHKSEDMTNVDDYISNLNEKWNSISTKLYSQSNSEQPQSEKQTENRDEKVEDVEFTEVK